MTEESLAWSLYRESLAKKKRPKTDESPIPELDKRSAHILLRNGFNMPEDVDRLFKIVLNGEIWDIDGLGDVSVINICRYLEEIIRQKR